MLKENKIKNPVNIRDNEPSRVCIRGLIFIYACFPSYSRDWAGVVKASGGGFRLCLKKIK